MATTPRQTSAGREIDYPTGDGKPMSETEVHWGVMVDLTETLKDRYAADPLVHVGSDLLLFYEEGNRRKHVAPDIFVVFGVSKRPMRENYLVWREGKAPDLIIEVTSKSTRAEDEKKKAVLYRDKLKVSEYFLFDPRAEYLKPPLQGYRLVAGEYEAIEPVAGRLPSDLLGLHFERNGTDLRLYDPATGRWLLTPREQADAARVQLNQTEAQLNQTEARLDQTEAENERLRRELSELRRRLGGE